jgi:hypothetical protein
LKPWLILKRDYGQLGNRLHTHANALAFAIEYNLNFLNLSFTETAKDFSRQSYTTQDRYLPQASILGRFLSSSKIVSVLQRLSLSDRLLGKLGGRVKVIDRKDDETLKEQDLFYELKSSTSVPIFLLRAWDVKCPQALEKHATQIRKRLAPNSETKKVIIDLLASIPPHTLLVGVHIRRGDYAKWLGGLHYHSWEQYYEWLSQIHNILLRKGHKPSYLLCSDESPPSNIFSTLPVIVGQRSPMTDLYALASCKLVLGPPSSFGSWASFYGEVPRIVLNAGDNVTNIPCIT